MQIKTDQYLDLSAFTRKSSALISKNEVLSLNTALKNKAQADIEGDPKLIQFATRAHKYAIINLSNPNEAPEYRYGNLTDVDDIEAFLKHQDRLSKDDSDTLRAYTPSKEYLTLLDKMNDETLNKFVDVLSRSFELGGAFSDKAKDKAQELISVMSKMSEDEIKSSVDTLLKLSEQEESAPISSAKLLLPAQSISHIELHIYSKSADFHPLFMQGIANNKLTHKYVDLLSSNKYTQGDMQNINGHLQQSSFLQSKGIIDMAQTVKRNEQASFIAMLSNAQKQSDNNVFAYISQQLNIDEHTSAYESSQGGYVLYTDSLPSDSQRSRFYSELLHAYESRGTGWVENVIEHVKERPPQMQNTIWQAINKDVNAKPEMYNYADSTDVWMTARLGSITHEFEQDQIKQINQSAYEADIPKNVGLLTWVKQTSLIFGG
ncbi:hypothetical protein PSECIP111951_01394 [Pseudoalteromonas holothuriae]|uniref:Uncharacterized protein n=1 Tax=Pseudoalteromonas holothuriae TaxID=2963714 RepID=A0ABM9GHA2_9GAMM|nr:hypothetical protein [Pseudoalteromonas sp. CIP111951]CAH9056106.1 hypothetical protein PSECIP111951_01394 [Pseudoalteromonas sp. CIP111951]